jgi:sec-independent protein translocase protein TatA
MKILGLGMPELVIILIVILIIFGPKNLPKLGKAIGRSVKGVRVGFEEANNEIKKKDEDDEDIDEPEVLEEEADTTKKTKASTSKSTKKTAKA